jgi:hypothetical protein
VELWDIRRDSNDVSTEAEEYLLLEAVARKRLVKTQQAGKLGVCCGDLWSVEISDYAVITCTYELCVYMANKSIHQSKPRL